MRAGSSIKLATDPRFFSEKKSQEGYVIDIDR